MRLRTHLFILYFLFLSMGLMAQSERKMTRKGNTQYETGNFVDAEINYKKALEKNGDLLEAQFNLGDALVKQERYDEALASFENVSSLTEDKNLKANALHNKGNVLLSKQDLEGALESYKASLRIDPKDNETRYNYAFVKKQLEQQQQQEQEQQQNEDNKEENKDDSQSNPQNNNDKQEDSENKEQEGSESEEKEENDNQQDQENKGQTDGEDADEEKEGQSPKPRKNKLSPEEAQRLLEALNQQEDQVQEKMKKHKLKGAKVKIEKDW